MNSLGAGASYRSNAQKTLSGAERSHHPLDKLAALFLIEVESLHSRSLGRRSVKGIHIPEKLAALADERNRQVRIAWALS
jgi:hypothetical protein